MRHSGLFAVILLLGIYTFLCKLLSSGVSKVPTDLLLVNRICLMWLGCKTMWLLSCPFTLSLPLALFNYLAKTNSDAILWAPQRRDPWGKELRVASEQGTERNEDLSSTILKELNPTTNQMNELGSIPTPYLSLKMTAAMAHTLTADLSETLSQGTLLCNTQIWDPQKLWDNKYYCFKPWNLGLICCIALDN